MAGAAPPFVEQPLALVEQTPDQVNPEYNVQYEYDNNERKDIEPKLRVLYICIPIYQNNAEISNRMPF